MSINISRYIQKNKIGEGGFGKVYLVQDNEVQQENKTKIFAAKISKVIISPESEEMISLSREVNINASINHPAVLKFIGYSPIDFNKNRFPVIITEYAENGSLFDLIDLERHSLATFDKWNDTAKLVIIYGIASGMKYLHDHEIIHRDLKPGNILLDSYLFPKIADFGLSKQNHQNPNSMTPQSTLMPKGTPNYIPLESFQTYKQTKSGDVYAFGLIVYELLTTKIPYKNMTPFQIYDELLKGRHPPFEIVIDDAYQNLIERCWSNDPDERPTFAQIVEELETNEDFIIPSVDKYEFLDYVDLIKSNPGVYNNNKIIDLEEYSRNHKSKIFQRINIRKYIEEQKDQSFISRVIRFFWGEKLYPAEEMEKLSEECQIHVLEADNDPEEQFSIGTNLIEEKNGFPLNIDLGVKYLERSIAGNNIESTYYLCDMLFKGKNIKKDLKKAKKYLSKRLGSNAKIDILYSKICMKEKNYKEAIKYFEKYANLNDPYALYKYGKMLFLGLGCRKNAEKGLCYINQSKNEGFQKSKLFLAIFEKLNEIQSFSILSSENQYYFLKRIINSNLNIDVNEYEKPIAYDILFTYDDTEEIFSSKFFGLNYFIEV